MNNVSLIGRLTKDPELKTYGKGKDKGFYARFTLAVQRDKDTTDFIHCVAFGKTAEIIDTYFGKGAKMGASGSIQTSSYEDDKGDKRYSTEVIVKMIDFCDGKAADDDDDDKPAKKTKKSSSAKSSKRRRDEDDEDEDDLDDELPFA